MNHNQTPNVSNNGFRAFIFKVIDNDSNSNQYSQWFDSFIIGLIILNVIAIILDSFESLSSIYGNFFWYFEFISCSIFSLEYLLRALTADFKFPHKYYLVSVWKYMKSSMAIIDLLAVLPFFLPMIFMLDFRAIRLLRLVRLLRILKLNRYFSSFKIIWNVLKSKKEELSVTIFITFVLLVIASTLMYFIENSAQPDSFPNILSSFWWAIATLTTVGYGDVYPVTAWGKVISSIIALLGIGLVALPTGILSSAFVEQIANKEEVLESNKKAKCYCPHCGEKLD